MSELDFKGFIRSGETKKEIVNETENDKISKNERRIYVLIIVILLAGFLGMVYYLSTNNYFKSEINQDVNLPINVSSQTNNQYNFTIPSPVYTLYNNITIVNNIYNHS